MNKIDKIWLYGSVSFSLFASLCSAIAIRSYEVDAEIAVAASSIRFCELVYGADSAQTVSWTNQVCDHFKMTRLEPRHQKTVGDFVIVTRREALNRCEKLRPIPDDLYWQTADSFLMDNRRYRHAMYFAEMDNLRKTIIRLWGKDSRELLTMSCPEGGDLLGSLSRRYGGSENDQTIVYETDMAFEEFRLAKLYHDECIQLTACEALIRLGEYYFEKKQYRQALAHYAKVSHCVPNMWQELDKKALIQDRIDSAKRALSET